MNQLEQRLRADVKKYIKWQTTRNFDGWEQIELFFDRTLSDAIVKAKPDKAVEFDTLKKRRTNRNVSAWFEKEGDEEAYQIALATKKWSYEEIFAAYVYEICHCLDYQQSVKNISLNEEEADLYFNTL